MGRREEERTWGKKGLGYRGERGRENEGKVLGYRRERVRENEGEEEPWGMSIKLVGRKQNGEGRDYTLGSHVEG